MSNVDPTGTEWSDREIDLIIADYFHMRRMEILREPYVKSRRNAALQEVTGRSRGAIEYKHQNISAVLQTLGMWWIPGYKPMANFQKSLIDGIERILDSQDDVFSLQDNRDLDIAEESAVLFEPPPVLRAYNSVESHALERLVRKFDPAERDARNRLLGKRGEERIVQSERFRLRDAGRSDLARKVRWVSEELGDGAGFDVLSFNLSGFERLLEVKTTLGHQRTPFYLTENERQLSAERPDEFRLVRLYDFLRSPKAFELTPPLEASVGLRPTNYRASF